MKSLLLLPAVLALSGMVVFAQSDQPSSQSPTKRSPQKRSQSANPPNHGDQSSAPGGAASSDQPSTSNPGATDPSANPGGTVEGSQPTTNPNASGRESGDYDANANRHHSWGWLGLIGLVGLFGMRRPRHEEAVLRSPEARRVP